MAELVAGPSARPVSEPPARPVSGLSSPDPPDPETASSGPPAGPARRLLPDSWRPRPDGRAELLATRCPRCGTLTFPVASRCPACWNADGLRTETVAAPGVVYAVTVVRVPEPGIEAPYRIGYADFPGGLRVCGRFTGPDVAAGDPVEVVAMVIRQQPDPLTGWAFRKAAA
jgi:uncharacterized OB-fold protein